MVNSPSDGSQRPVADALLISGNSPAGGSEPFSITGLAQSPLSIGDVSDLKDTSGRPVETGIWGTDGKGVFIDQGGRLRVMRAGTSKISIAYPGKEASASVKLIDPNLPVKPKTPPAK